MKAAICLSGHLRDYLSVYKNFISFKKVLESKFDQVDVFIATWSTLNTISSWSAEHGISTEGSDEHIDVSEICFAYETPVEHVIAFEEKYYASTISPLSYSQHTNSVPPSERGILGEVFHSSKMFFLINHANELKRIREYYNNEVYDVVIRCRPDSIFDLSVCEEVPIHEMNRGLYIHGPLTDGYKSYATISDQFALGSSKSMNHYSNCLLSLSHSWDKGIFGNSEALLYEHLCRLGYRIGHPDLDKNINLTQPFTTRLHRPSSV